MKRKLWAIVLALCLCASLCVPMAQAESACPSTAEVTEILLEFETKEGYTEGTPWTNNTHKNYNWQGGKIDGANIVADGCVYFAFQLSDAAFGNLPARVIEKGNFTIKDVRPGDILRVDNSAHTVIVVRNTGDAILLAEGNYNGQVHWGRTMDATAVAAADRLITRYPENFVDSTDPDANKPLDNGTGDFGNGLHWEITKAGTLTISGTGSMPDFSAATDQPWSSFADRILRVELREGVSNIGACAFMSTSVLSVSIPSTVRTIGSNAFRASKLTSVSIPGTVTAIGDDAFNGCKSLASVIIGEGVETIGERSFNACSTLTSISIPASIKSVGAGAFWQCGEMTRAQFAASAHKVELGDNLFTQCYKLMQMTLPSQINKIGEGMFQNCLMLSEVVIPNGAESIGGSAFASCSTLTTVTIPTSVTSIGTAAFSACSRLAAVKYRGTEVEWSRVSLLGDTGSALSGKVSFNNTDGTSHTHSWATAWSRDSTHHWHDCTADGCDVVQNSGKDGYAAHIYTDDSDMTCDTCGYDRTADPEAHTHDWATAWSSDNTSHWHECLADDCDVTANNDKDGYGAHVYDNDTDATCNTCGYTRTITPPAHTHNWATTWSSDSMSHWHECTAAGCDVTANSSKDGYGAHVYDNDADATCNTCGYTRTIIPPAHTHNWATTWSSDSMSHWHECTAPGCDVTANSSKDGYGAHTYSSFLGSTCLVCGYNRGFIDPIPTPSVPSYEPVTPPAPSPTAAVSAAPSPSASAAPSASASARPSSSASASAQPSSAQSSAPSTPPTANPTAAPSSPPDPTAVVPVDPPQGISVPEDSPVQFVQQNETVAVTGFEAARASEAPTVRDLLKNIGVQGGTSVTVVNADGVEASPAAPLRTGQVVTVVQNGEIVMEAPVVVRGDVLGTGEMTLAQVVRLADALRGVSPLEGAFLQAGDFTGSGTVTLTDLVQQAKLYLESNRG